MRVRKIGAKNMYLFCAQPFGQGNAGKGYIGAGCIQNGEGAVVCRYIVGKRVAARKKEYFFRPVGDKRRACQIEKERRVFNRRADKMVVTDMLTVN